MIRRLLTQLEHGSITFSELALDFSLTEQELKNRLEMMVRMGHLEAIPIDMDSSDSEGDCPGCIFSGRCRTDTCTEGSVTVGYRLTEKGHRLALQEGEGAE